MKNRVNIRMIWLLLGSVLFSLVFSYCKTTQQAADYKDLSYLYNPTKSPINPFYNIINQTDQLSVLSIRFATGDLFFSEANSQGVPAASVTVNVKLYNMKERKNIVDTAILKLAIVKDKSKQDYIYHIPLKVEKGNEYVVEVKILDHLRLITAQAFVQFNTLSETNRYNFRVNSHFEKHQLFTPVLRIDEYVNLVYTRGHIDSLFVSFYKPFKEVPDPPSMLLPEKTLDYEPRQVVALPYSDTLPMMFPKEGIYLCSIARNIKDGFTFLNFGPTYPKLTTPEAMIEPLAYLASQDEMTALRESRVNQRQHSMISGLNAEEMLINHVNLIRIYYTRVMYSNYYFTSYKEGWRTERGMIYIIYGPPDKVYKTADGESWGYKKPSVKSKWGSRYNIGILIFSSILKRKKISSQIMIFTLAAAKVL